MTGIATPPLSPPQLTSSLLPGELFASAVPASAHAEFPPKALSPLRPPSLPFPVFQHRHSAPYASTHSFSALGPPPAAPSISILSLAAPPAAPKLPTMVLPIVAPDGSELSLQSTLPPTPEPTPPSSKVLLPETMIKLAPPADDDAFEFRQDEDDARGVEQDVAEEKSRRIPLISINTVEVNAPDDAGEAGPSPQAPIRAKTQATITPPAPLDHRPSHSQPAHRRPIQRSQTANGVSAMRTMEALRTDERPRQRSVAQMAVRQHSSHHTFGSPAPGLPRSLTAATATSRSESRRPEGPDLGGPDGLEAKVVLLGSQGVGKTSLILRFTTRTFSPSPAAATIGSSLHTRKLVHSGIRVKLQIWDTAGQERFRSMAPIYYRGAHVCVLVYDTSDRTSFEDVRSWLEELGRTVSKETVIYVVGAKIDLERKRTVSIDEARRTIRTWLRPSPPPLPEHSSPPPPRRLFKGPSDVSRGDPNLSSPTPSRPYPHSVLAIEPLSAKLPLPPPPPAPPPILAAVAKKSQPPQRRSVPFPSARPTALPGPGLATTPISTTHKRLSFPALHSPSRPTSVTFTDPVRPSMPPPSSTGNHGSSGGRYSISGVLGYNRTPSISGAISTLSRLAEDYPPSRLSQLQFPPTQGRPSPPPARVRVESSPNLSADHPYALRRSEDWSSMSWRMGEGPSAAEALGEFGDGVKRKQSGEILSPFTVAELRQPTVSSGRARGGSLGRDSRLYGTGLGGVGRGEGEADGGWGVEIEGVRIGECSALSGEGVEALFKSISSLLVEKKDKIERERTLRRKNSVLLVDPAKHPVEAAEISSRGGCCV